MDKIFIEHLKVEAILGVYERERHQGQMVDISVTLETDTRMVARSDDLQAGVDYDALSRKIRAHVRAAARRTVEALAQDIADLCLQTPGVRRVTVRVAKPEAIPDIDSVGVEIVRP